MLRPQFSARGGGRAASSLFANDLCAQLVPLNRYGPTQMGAALATAIRSLTGAARPVVCAAAGCERD